jgi:glyoxylase-like metal-dependent hydrolase (beta-lactamase superfamily II)
MSARYCAANYAHLLPEDPLPPHLSPAGSLPEAAVAFVPSSASASGAPADDFAGLSASLGLSVLERGWLSANQAVFETRGTTPATVVDTGFSGHAEQTLALIDHALAGTPVGRILNTHLHSDHCGANHALQRRGGVETWIPLNSVAAVRAWNEAALTFRLTDQPCPRFKVDRALVPGETIALGEADWQVHAAPGHDMDAILLFEPQTRTLIAGDALWEERLAIIFPELMGADGFAPTRATLALIERLQPTCVVPGHGRPFGDVERALAASRSRLDGFEQQPDRHTQHAARALLMFHLLDIRRSTVSDLVSWMLQTPIFRMATQRAGLAREGAARWALGLVDRLVGDGALTRHGELVGLPAHS